MNYDPMTASEIRARLASAFGPLSGLIRLALSPLPLGAVAGSAALLDRRPGRLVSFLCHKQGKD